MTLDPQIRRVLDGTPIAHVATVLPDGSPHSVPVWVGTRGDQIVFLNLTIDTNPLKTLWQWPGAKDMEANAEAIFKFYTAAGRVSDIYRHVLEVKGNNGGEMQVMPRAVAAAQLRIVLGWILGGKTGLS